MHQNVHQKTQTEMFIAVISVTVRAGNKPRSINSRMRTLWCENE